MAKLFLIVTLVAVCVAIAAAAPAKQVNMAILASHIWTAVIIS